MKNTEDKLDKAPEVVAPRLYNHRCFHQLLEQEVVRAERYPQPIPLFIIDIDDFKRYNDTRGDTYKDIKITKGKRFRDAGK